MSLAHQPTIPRTPLKRLWHLGRYLRYLLYLRYLVALVVALAVFGSIVWAIASLQPFGFVLFLYEVLGVAFGMWALSLIIWRVGQQERAIWTHFFSSQFLAADLIFSIHAQLSSLGKLGYALAITWTTATLLHFFLTVTKTNATTSRQQGKRRINWRHWLVCLGYLYALGQTLYFLIIPDSYALPSDPSGGAGWLFAICVLLISSLFNLALLLRATRSQNDERSRQLARFLLLGTIVSLAPLLVSILLNVIAVFVFNYSLSDLQTLLTVFYFSIPFLLLYPASYGYALFSKRFARLEAMLSRSTLYYLAVAILTITYVIIALLVQPLLTGFPWVWPLLSGVVIILALITIRPLQRMLERFIAWTWYDDQLDALDALERVTEQLSMTLDQHTLSTLLTSEVPAALRLRGASLFLQQHDTQLRLIHNAHLTMPQARLAASEIDKPHAASTLSISTAGALASCLLRLLRPLDTEHLHAELRHQPMTPTEQALLAMPLVAWWVPLISAGTLQGLLLLGERRAQEPFNRALSPTGMQFLKALARQAAIAAHNVRLAEEAIAGREELAHAHRESLLGREHERQLLARELHDGAVQHLIGISYQLVQARQHLSNSVSESAASTAAATLSADDIETIRQETLDVVSQLRQVMSELRPAGLDELGLTTALESAIERVRRSLPADAPIIEADLDQSETTIPEAVGICLLRAAQETLRNALNHAHAQHIQITLRLSLDRILLAVRDDGCGFQPPPRLSELTQADHFGLVGVAERVASVGGSFEIVSQPGVGTQVTIQILLPPAASQMPVDESARDEESDVYTTYGYSHRAGR